MKTLNVGMIGAGFMGKAHAMAYAAMPMFFWPAPAITVRKMVADVTEEAAKDAALRLGFESYTADWRDIINNPEIDIVDIVTPNDSHAEIAIAAARAGKHIICEKPLARGAEESRPCSTRFRRQVSSTWWPSTTAAPRPSRWRKSISTKVPSARC
jgi:predicted dehydrogenase